MKILFAIIVLALVLASCSDDNGVIAPSTDGGDVVVSDTLKINLLNGIELDDIKYLGDDLNLSVELSDTLAVSYLWSIDEIVFSHNKTVQYTSSKVGKHSLKLEVSNAATSDKIEISFYVFRPVTSASSKWISELIEYRPAPGQFINKSPGNIDSAEGIVGKKGMVTLGAYGGYVVFKFDHTVMNIQGYDFVIHGNAFDNGSEAGAVMVAYDSNGNGVADSDEWFELKGSEYDKSIKGYEITYTKPSQFSVAENILWSDNQGGLGKVTAISFHKQCYYPLFLTDNPDHLLFRGNRVSDTAKESGGFWSLATLDWGYVDNFSAEYNEKIGDDSDTERSNKFDVDNAVDNNGVSIKLKGVDFIKVYNCLNQEAGWLGEVSTEVCGAISLSVTK